MKILLDECVPWPLRHVIVGHDCMTASYRGWGGFSNGELLRMAEAEFELFITADQNLPYQQNLAERRIAILELSTNDLRRLQAAAGLIATAVNAMVLGDYLHLDIP